MCHQTCVIRCRRAVLNTLIAPHNTSMHTILDNAFEHLKLDEDSSFCPRKGFEHTRGSETWDFYVVTRGFVPGIYTHWCVSIVLLLWWL
jgi:hypothetical protein